MTDGGTETDAGGAAGAWRSGPDCPRAGRSGGQAMPYGLKHALKGDFSRLGQKSRHRKVQADEGIEGLMELLTNAPDDYVAIGPLTELNALVAEGSALLKASAGNAARIGHAVGTPRKGAEQEKPKSEEDVQFERDCRSCNRVAIAKDGGLDTIASWVKSENGKVALLAVQLLWGACIGNEANQAWLRDGYALRDLVSLLDCGELRVQSAANSALVVCGIDGKVEKESFALMQSAELQMNAEQYDGAILAYTKCLENFKEYDRNGDGLIDNTEKPGLWMCYVGRARAYEKLKQWDKLADEATKLVETILPDRALGYAMLARAKIQAGEFDLASELIKQGEACDAADGMTLPDADLKGIKALLSAMTGGEELLAAEDEARENAISVLQTAVESAPDNAQIKDLLYLADRRAATLLQEIVDAEQTGRAAFKSTQLARSELAEAPSNHGFGLDDTVGEMVIDTFKQLKAFDAICEKLKRSQGDGVEALKTKRTATAKSLEAPVKAAVDKIRNLHTQLNDRKKILDTHMDEVNKALHANFPGQSLRDVRYDEQRARAICITSAALLQAALDEYLPFFASPPSFDGSDTVLGPRLTSVIDDLEAASSEHVSTYSALRHGKILQDQADEVKARTRKRFELEKKMEKLVAKSMDQCRQFLLSVKCYLQWKLDMINASCHEAQDILMALSNRLTSVSSLEDTDAQIQKTHNLIEQATKNKILAAGRVRRTKGDLEEKQELRSIGEEVGDSEIDALRSKLEADTTMLHKFVTEIAELTSRLAGLTTASGEGGGGPAGIKDLRVARKLQHDYQNVEALSGGKNVLYRANFNDQKVVLKGYKGEVDQETFAKQLAELTRLRHPTIIHADAFFYDPQEKTTFVQMELCSAGNFRTWQSVKARTPTEIHSVMRQALLGLVFLHERNIIHGDIKPEALLMYSDTELRIGDFELHHSLPENDVDPDSVAEEAPAAEEAIESETADFYEGQYKGGDVEGSAGYQAPELIASGSQSTMTTAIDVWAFGAVIFEVFYKKRPQQDAMGHVMVPVETLNANVSDMLGGMLAADPSERPSSSCVNMSPYFTTPPWEGAFNEAFSLAERRLHAFHNFMHSIRTSENWLSPLEIRVTRANISDFILQNWQSDWILRKTTVYFEHQFDEELMTDLGRPYEPRVGSQVAEMFRIFWLQIVEYDGLWEIDPNTKCVHVARDEYAAEDTRTGTFEVIGGMLAKCALEGYTCPIKFAPAVFKHLLDLSDTVNLRDMQACPIDYDQLRELKVLAASPNYSTVARNINSGIAGLTFDNLLDLSSETQEKVKVTDDSKLPYVIARVQDHQIFQRQEGLDAMRSGFSVITETVLKYMVPQTVLTGDDLMIALQGYGAVSARDFVSRLRFTGFGPSAKLPTYFSDLVAKMSNMQLSTLLLYITGSPTIPVDGLRNPSKDWGFPDKITIVGSVDDHLLPTAHTQYYALETQDYPDEQSFLEALELGLLAAEGVTTTKEDLGVYGGADPGTLSAQADKLLVYLATLVEDTGMQPEPDPMLPPPPGAAEVAVVEESGQRATALYDYPAEQDGDLPMYADQVVIITANAGQWWSGYLEDDPSQTVGQFPANVSLRSGIFAYLSLLLYCTDASSTVRGSHHLDYAFYIVMQAVCCTRSSISTLLIHEMFSATCAVCRNDQR